MADSLAGVLMIAFFLAQALGYLLLAALTFSPLLLPFVLLREQKLRPAVVGAESVRRHLPLIYLIRGTEVLFGVVVLPGMGMVAFGVFMEFSPFHQPRIINPFVSLGLCLVMVMLFGFLIWNLCRRLLASWRDGMRDFWRVSVNSISSFAMFFAAFLSHDLYHFLPPVNHFARHGPTLLDRDFLWIAAFWGVWLSTKALLIRLLDVRPPPPRDDPTSDPPPDAPEFPQRSPLVEL